MRIQKSSQISCVKVSQSYRSGANAKMFAHKMQTTTTIMLNKNKNIALALALSASLLAVAEGGPASYATCQAGCAAAAGIAMCMSGGVCSVGCAAAYSACQSACAAAAFAPMP